MMDIFIGKDEVHFHFRLYKNICEFTTRILHISPFLSNITVDRKKKVGNEKKDEWKERKMACRPGPTNGLISKAPPQEGFLAPDVVEVKFTLDWRLGGHIRMNRMIRRELARIAVLLRIPLVVVNAGGPPQWNFSIEHLNFHRFKSSS